MTYRIVYVARLTRDQAEQCAALQALYGQPQGVAPKPLQRAWLALTDEDSVAGFATACRRGSVVELTNCVVAPEHRGNGLQARLLRLRLAWAYAGRKPALRVETHTAGDNYHSQANLVDAGFKLKRIVRDEAARGGAWLEWVYGA